VISDITACSVNDGEYFMNKDFEAIKSILLELRADYLTGCNLKEFIEKSPITERDIVAEIYCQLKSYCSNRELSAHCEIKPAPSVTEAPDQLKRLPKIDVCILSNENNKSWVSSAIKLQNGYKKGLIEARFSSIPINFFHTAIEVKIQSKIPDAKKDIDILKDISDSNETCNCFFILLNSRGKRSDHDAIQRYANQKRIFMLEYTCK